MRYSNSYIKKMGKILIESKIQEEVSLAESVVEAWRGQHDIVLDEFESRLYPILKENKIVFVDKGRRLKRLLAIKNKMDRHDVWNLSTMQDVGGVRIIFSSLDDLYDAKNLLTTNCISEFVIDDVVDYIEKPRNTGYRAIHFVFRYLPNDKTHDCYGQKIELQLRTKIQHAWAMGVETAELITGSALKDGVEDSEWQVFFRDISVCFYSVDIGSCECKKNEKEIIDSIVSNTKINPKYIEDLRSVMTMVTINDSEGETERKSEVDGYYLMDVNYKSRLSRIVFFPKEERDKAIENYNQQERENEGQPKDVILVSVPSIKNLKEMYPSYYFDASKFISLAYKFVK